MPKMDMVLKREDCRGFGIGSDRGDKWSARNNFRWKLNFR